jgi:hypothetical protein
MAQLSLFPDLSPLSSFPLVPRTCRCGCTWARLGSSHSVHAGRLTCDACGVFVGWASHVLVAEIHGFVTGTSSFEPGCAP